MRGGAWGLAALCAGLAACGGVSAQQIGGGAPAPGAARAYNVDANLQVEHETNLVRASAVIAARGNVTPADTVYAPSVVFNFVQPLGRQALYLNGTAAYLFHQKNKTLDNEQVNLSGGAVLVAGPCHVVLTGGYVRGRNELNNPAARLPGATLNAGPTDTSLTNASETTVFNIQTGQEAGAVLACNPSAGLGIVAQAEEQQTSNSQSVTSNGRFRTYVGSAGISYQRPSLGALSLVANYSRTNVQGQSQPALTPGGFETVGASLSYTRQLGGRIELSVTGGYVTAHILNPPAILAGAGQPSDFSGTTYAAEASFRATSRLQAKASLQRQISPTLLTGNSYELQTSYDLGLNYQIGSRIAVSLVGNRQQSEVNGVVTVPLAATLTNSLVNSLSVSVGYKMSRRLSFRLVASRETRTADNPDFNYTNDRVGLSLNATL